MNPRIALWGLAGVCLALVSWLGCDYSPPESSVSSADSQPNFALSASKSVAPGTETGPANAPRATEERTAILESSMTLIERAALQPGGKNFELAVKKLNQYFQGTPRSAYQLSPGAREYLATQLPPKVLQSLENRNWTIRDARHLEDCMMYYGIANRVAGSGEDIDRIRRVFDWVVRQVQLVPPGTLASGRVSQVIARPYDVLLRGMATEADGFWAERAWVFMVLCRQLGIDVGMITYSKSDTLELQVPRYDLNFEVSTRHKVPIVWICAALIDGRIYLFDARLGLEIPGPGGEGVATLDQALADPAILERMNLPGLAPYGTSRASLLGSPTKIGILVDSSPGYFSPKMKLLQAELSGKHRTVLYRDPGEQHDQFARALDHHAGPVALWPIPLDVETRLFTDARYVESIQASLFLFRPEWPLIYARVKQLRGEFDQAIDDYVKFRFNENTPLVTNKKQVIPKEVRNGLDVYATYYLALAHLERNDLRNAIFMFEKTRELLPEPGPNQPYYTMFRRGANVNLGRIYETEKPVSRAVIYYTRRDPTQQYLGSLLRARELVWRDPMGAAAAAPPLACGAQTE